MPKQDHWIATAGVHPLPVVAPSPVVAAERYAAAMDILFGHDPKPLTVTVEGRNATGRRVEMRCEVNWRGEFWEARLFG